MKICFVQPSTDYQVEKNRYAFALTFPQLISDMGLEETNYVVYISGKCKKDFRRFLKEKSPTHVFITAITSTFPYAEEMAEIAKECQCIVVLGGVFASINYKVITNNFSCFDYVVVGHPNYTLLSYIIEKPNSPQYIVFSMSSNYEKELGDIIIDVRFRNYFREKDIVCYELTNGCRYNCNFCTMRQAFPKQRPISRSISIIQKDIDKIARQWRKLKLIDDDICNSIHLLKYINLNSFREVIAEIRVDEITENNMQILSCAGITHLIVGVETFDPVFLKRTRKTADPNSWGCKIEKAIRLCQKYKICMRPVVMVVNDSTTICELKKLPLQMKGWTPDNNIEVFCSFYTPHPGMATKKKYESLLTNDIRCFDHLHCVWLPPVFKNEERVIVKEIYSEIVEITKSYEYNPLIEYSCDYIGKYDCFFKDPITSESIWREGK